VELCDQAVGVLSRRAARLEAAGRGGAVNEDWQKLLPLLVHIQANLDGDLRLVALSRKAGLLPSYFHRVFKAAIGETPGDYVMRFCVERGAFRLLLHDARLVDVALDRDLPFRQREYAIATEPDRHILTSCQMLDRCGRAKMDSGPETTSAIG